MTIEDGWDTQVWIWVYYTGGMKKGGGEQGWELFILDLESNTGIFPI